MPTDPTSLFSLSYDQGGRLHTCGGVTSSPDGILFAHEHLIPQEPVYWGVIPVIDWRHWDDFSLARIGTEPYPSGGIGSLASSPDGRWLVVGVWNPWRLFLLDWQTGEIMSHHAIGGMTTALTFDATSTYVAGFACHDNWGHCSVWRLDPAAQAHVRPQGDQWWAWDGPPDQISGSMALSEVHWELDRTGMKWPGRDLADSACQIAFSPASRLVIFSPMNSGYSGCGLELVAYEVVSGQRRWCVRQEMENSGPFLVGPDGSVLLVPMQDGDLHIYRLEDGALLQQLPTHLNEPVQTLAFDHRGRLWLATEEQLLQYRPQS